MNKALFEAWSGVVPELGNVLRAMDEKTIIAVGSLPYTRIIPSFFLRNYHIYSVKDVSDIDVLKDQVHVTSLEQFAPKVAARVASTGYLLNNYVFQGFLKSRRHPFRLFLNQTTPPIVESLTKQGLDWIGNDPNSFEPVLHKAVFRALIKQLKLPHLPDQQLSRADFLEKSFAQLYAMWQGPVVVQRADAEVGGVQGTFFVHTEEDWQHMHNVLAKDERYTTVQITPYVKGNSLSMLGCITHLGLITTPLQLQLIDVPQALGGNPATGIFLGHDWGFQQWSSQTEQAAQKVVEAIGDYLSKRGFKGIFGIDFMHDTQRDELFPLECNPRPTGALPVFSLMTLWTSRVPPLEFFHLMTHLRLPQFFDIETINREIKEKLPITHLSLSPHGVETMQLPLRAGIYSFNPDSGKLHYERAEAFPWNIQAPESEALVIDSIPRLGAAISKGVPRLFKLIFSRSIAKSSYQIDDHAGQLASRLIAALKAAQNKNSSL